jgi:hypothetical protein
MAGKPQERPMRVNSDSAQEHLGEPNFTEEMSLQPSGGSTLIGIPAAAVKFLGYEVGESREVEVYQDGVFIPREAPDE